MEESLCSLRTKVMGTVLLLWAGNCALEYINTKLSPQTLPHVVVPCLVLPLNPRQASSADTQTEPQGATDVDSSWANLSWSILVQPAR